MKLTLAFALAIFATAGPALAQPGQHLASAHLRPQLFHDRSPHIHNRGSQPHREA